MSQERLNGLALISIENDVASKLNYSDLLSAFASAKARKVNFNNNFKTVYILF